MHFDARAAKQLQPGQHMVVDGCQGLRLEVSASRRTWIYRYKLAGKMKQVALGHWPAMPIQAAVAAWDAARTARAAGEAPRRARVSAPVPMPAVYLVRGAVMDFAEHLATVRKPAGVAAAVAALTRFLDQEPDLADMPAEHVTRGLAFAALDSRAAFPAATAKLRSLLGGAWALALDAGRIGGDTPNWWRQVLHRRLRSKGKIIGGRHVGQARRVLQAEEVGALLRWLPHMHDVAADVTVLYLWTCARGAEILSMQQEQVSQERDGWWWTVPKAATKNAGVADAVSLRVPLIGRALEVARRRLEGVAPGGDVFVGAKGSRYRQKDFSTYIYDLQPYSVKKLIRPAREALPVTGWSPHNLRRTGRTLLAGLGCPNEIGEAILGHVPADIVATYNAHTYDAERRHWLGLLAAHLEDLAAADLPPSLPARP